jgi:hypothetical protein
MSTETQRRTRPIHLILAWAFVGIPLLWGVWQTAQNALKLLMPS